MYGLSKNASDDIGERMKDSLREGTRKKVDHNDNVGENIEVERDKATEATSKRKATEMRGRIHKYFAPRTTKYQKCMG